MSHVDGFLVGACVQRFIRFMVWKPYYQMKALHWFFRKTNAIPVGGGRDAIEAIRAARRERTAGHVVCIFAEGAISRTGNILPFKRGMERIVEGLDVPIIPVHLDRLWGSIFSFEHGRFFWKWPKSIPYPVTVSFGNPMPANSTAHEVRQAIQELAAEATAHRQTAGDTLLRRLIRSARRNWSHFAIADSTGRELTYGRMLTGGLLVAQWARTRRDEEMIGVLLPPSVAGALVNVGITLAGRVPGDLNFTAGAGGGGGGARAMRDSHGSDVARVSGQGEDRGARRHGLRGGYSGARGDGGPAASAACNADRAICAGSSAGRRGATGNARDRHLLPRQHGHPERRDALALQRAGEYRSDSAAFPDRRARSQRGRAV